MALYKSVPHEVEAVQVTGENTLEIAEFMAGISGFVKVKPGSDNITIVSDDGDVTANVGDFIVKHTVEDAFVYTEQNFRLIYNRVA